MFQTHACRIPLKILNLVHDGWLSVLVESEILLHLIFRQIGGHLASHLFNLCCYFF